ncbi:PAS domain S-box protein [Polaribacter pectinis]|uniref:histidine kinase n=1 Tax=Polaribacter pectinis TaxID=2738844 RepID=A0A7G9LE58_9FLAO|nr:ATP-binding protein [Polaribacter pectinis]QNM86907.1 PAS domain S-box protein [Polaribacter pectinis]
MSQDKIDILQRALMREKSARKIAEKILEDKSRDLYFVTQELKKSNIKLEKLLDEKSSQLKGVFENIIDSYIVMELSGNVLKMNDAAIELFGYDNKIEKVNVNDFIYEEDIEYAFDSFNKLNEKGHFSNYTTRIITKEKKIKWVQVNGSLIFDKNKNPIAAQGIIRDISTLKSLESQKEKILIELEKSNKELQEYAHMVSHDLKTPLRSIDALVSWVKMDNQGKLDEVTLQNLDLIGKTLETMENLISNILEYSSAGVVVENVKDVDLNLMFEDVKRLLFIPENITLKVLKNLPIIKGDTTKFQQIFQNLVSNAIKFTNKEAGIVEIDFLEKPSFYQFSVKDNGIGIEKKYHDKIFKIFHSLNKNKESTGIGLSIVKKVVEFYEGNIWLESEEGKGTTFYFTIKK